MSPDAIGIATRAIASPNEIFTRFAAYGGMSAEPASLDRLLAESVGEGSPAAAELRALFLASATGHVAAMSQADGAASWRQEALRLQGLAASFGVTALMAAAARAADGGPDPLLLDAVADALAACRA